MSLYTFFTLQTLHQSIQEVAHVTQMLSWTHHTQQKMQNSQRHPSPIKYLQENIETIPCLVQEKAVLQALPQHLSYLQAFHHWLHYLNSESNALDFIEEPFSSFAIRYSLSHPVYMSQSDLNTFFYQLQHADFPAEQPAPFFLFKKFQLTKKQGISQDQIYLVDMEILSL